MRNFIIRWSVLVGLILLYMHQPLPGGILVLGSGVFAVGECLRDVKRMFVQGGIRQCDLETE